MRLLFKIGDLLRHKARLRRWNRAHAWGRRGEDIAHRFLREQGFQVVARNYRTANGSAEVDLIAWEGSTIVFVEVKTRGTDEFGAPEEAVDVEKRRHIQRGAADYLRRAELSWNAARFDIVSVVVGQKTQVTHFRDAFRPATSL
jgi:putative endonuclease